MDYFETLEYLFSQLPMYQRSGPAAYKADLNNTIALCALLGNPEKELKYIHVAGTNGKGTVSHMLAYCLQEQGYRTGLYTSPHYKDFRERIRVNGRMIGQDEVIEFTEKFKDGWNSIQPSFFEITVAMAFWHFKNQEVDIAVIETGLGGRLDSTNVITPELSIITNVDFDHMALLGNSIEEIAFEKGGIIKSRVPAVVGEMRAEAKAVLKKLAEERAAVVHDVSDIQMELPDMEYSTDFQKENTKTALLGLKVLKSLGWTMSVEHIVSGLENLRKNTGYMGRWQVLGEKPLIIADSGHNPAGLKHAMSQLAKLEFDYLHIILGVVADKDLGSILPLLPKNANYYFCQANIDRAMPAENLQEKAAEFKLHGEVYATVQRAYEAARLYATPADVIFVGGSIFTVAEVL